MFFLGIIHLVKFFDKLFLPPDKIIEKTAVKFWPQVPLMHCTKNEVFH